MDDDANTWARRFKRHNRWQYDEALLLVQQMRGVRIAQKDDCGRRGEYLWAITPDIDSEFWLDAFEEKEKALALCREMGWDVIHG